MVEDAPFSKLEDLGSLDIPALVIETAEDALHPTSVARQIADSLPRPSLQKTPPRYLEPERHADVVQRLVKDFVRDIQEVETA